MVIRSFILSSCLLIIGLHDALGQQWQQIAPMLIPRARAACEVLPDGRILVIGGQQIVGISECEIYDPKTDAWSKTGSLNSARFWFAHAHLPDGRIFVAGGITSFSSPRLSSCEIFDPVTEKWKYTASMQRPHSCFDAQVLPDGKLLLLGGVDSTTSDFSHLAEVFDPTTETFSSVADPLPSFSGYEMVYSPLLQGIVAVGGIHESEFEPGPLSYVQLFDIATSKWKTLPSIPEAVSGYHQVVRTNDNKVVLLAGRNAYHRTTHHVQVFDESTKAWSTAGSLPFGHDYGSSFSIHGDTILTVGGLEIPGTFSTMNPVSLINLKSGSSWVGPRPLLPVTSQCAVQLHQNNGCTEGSTIYLFGGHDSTQMVISFCQKIEFDFTSSSPQTASSQLNVVSTFFQNVAPVEMTVDISSNAKFDSIWPFIQTLSASYSWDTSIVVFEGYHPPTGWSLVSLQVGENTASFTIRKSNALLTTPLDIGKAEFMALARKGSSLVTLNNLSISHGGDQSTYCIQSDEGHYWMVSILGDASVSEYPSASITRWQLFDLLGRLICVGDSDFNEHDLGGSLSSGAYLLRTSKGGNVQTKRVIFVK